jgi:hypothetical protein
MSRGQIILLVTMFGIGVIGGLIIGRTVPVRFVKPEYTLEIVDDSTVYLKPVDSHRVYVCSFDDIGKKLDEDNR